MITGSQHQKRFLWDSLWKKSKSISKVSLKKTVHIQMRSFSNHNKKFASFTAPHCNAHWRSFYFAEEFNLLVVNEETLCSLCCWGKKKSVLCGYYFIAQLSHAIKINSFKVENSFCSYKNPARPQKGTHETFCVLCKTFWRQNYVILPSVVRDGGSIKADYRYQLYPIWHTSQRYPLLYSSNS